MERRHSDCSEYRLVFTFCAWAAFSAWANWSGQELGLPPHRMPSTRAMTSSTSIPPPKNRCPSGCRYSPQELDVFQLAIFDLEVDLLRTGAFFVLYVYCMVCLSFLSFCQIQQLCPDELGQKLRRQKHLVSTLSRRDCNFFKEQGGFVQKSGVLLFSFPQGYSPRT